MIEGSNSETPVPDRLILASASPRRAELLRAHGFAFSVVPSPVAEPNDFHTQIAPTELAERISRHKAESVARIVPEGLILAADTLAALDQSVFGKPVDRQDARRILRSISGTRHHVITGVTLLDAQSGWRLTRHDVTTVTMRRLSDEELESYLDTNAWIDKAGAYGIQDQGDAFVERIDGSFTNVVGLPMELLARMLASLPTAT
ncbi:MAG: Maf family protein [Planctomycetota bacterium]